MRTRLILTVCLLFFCVKSFAAAYADKSADGADTAQRSNETAVYIRGIEVYGSVVTRPEILRHFITFDTGEVLDTSKLRQTRAGLLATQLYDKADIFPHIREDGAHIFIILKESVRLQLGYGGVYSVVKYGRDDLWFSFSFDAGIENFRGRMEELWFGIGFWDRRSLDLAWTKPFLSTPYFITVGAGVAQYPDYVLPLDYTDLYARAGVGRKFGRYSRLSVSATPIYRRRDIVEWAVDPTIPTPESFGDDIYEAFGALTYSIDRRNARFDPKNGWWLSSQIRTNRLYKGENIPFFQFTNEFRYYLPIGGLGDMFAARARLTLRDRDAGSYHRLVHGNAGEIRGYSDDQLGWEFIANSSILASLKFQRPLYKTPAAPMPFVDMIFGVKNVSFRIDGSLIADYARLYREPTGALTFDNERQSGIGLGFGMRILAPEIKQSGCIELVFGRIDDKDGTRWKPATHVYLDMFF